ncbi:MAG: hypothetical protein WBO84_13725 [Acidimicrobiia bacterium]
MVTLADPILKRLVEVNPAPDDFELPPVSDVALFESILERARSEELSFRPVRVRSWRPGLVVAAAAFVTVLVVAGAIGLLSGLFSEQEGPVVTEPPVVTTVAPVPTTVPPTVTTVAPTPTTVPPTETTVPTTPTTVPRYEVTINALDDGAFTASGSAVDAAAMCDEGVINVITISTEPGFPAGGEYSDYYTASEEHTLACADGSGTIVVGMNVNQSQLSAGYFFSGEWVVTRGTGRYERVTGTGAIDGSCDPDRANCTFEYTGRLDLTRDVATAPTAPAPTGRRALEITYQGGFKDGLFTATGPAVEAGLFCADGLTSRVCVSTEFGNSVKPCEDTFFCADGTGWTTLRSDIRESSVQAQGVDILYDGPWTAIGGSGIYESVTGSGRLSGVAEEGDARHTIWLYTGQFDIS